MSKNTLPGNASSFDDFEEGPPPASPPSPPPRKYAELLSVLEQLREKSLQPPVLASFFGIFLACVSPLRAIFVDVGDRNGDAPLQFLFDAIVVLGKAAIPLNMFILGGNLWQTFVKQRAKGARSDDTSPVILPLRTSLGIVVGKLVVMPIIGMITALLLRGAGLYIPEPISATFYLVFMLVFTTPTANNVMVLCEIGGTSKEMMAQSIFVQYLFSPILLTASVTAVVAIVSGF